MLTIHYRNASDNHIAHLQNELRSLTDQIRSSSPSDLGTLLQQQLHPPGDPGSDCKAHSVSDQNTALRIGRKDSIPIPLGKTLDVDESELLLSSDVNNQPLYDVSLGSTLDTLDPNPSDQYGDDEGRPLYYVSLGNTLDADQDPSDQNCDDEERPLYYVSLGNTLDVDQNLSAQNGEDEGKSLYYVPLGSTLDTAVHIASKQNGDSSVKSLYYVSLGSTLDIEQCDMAQNHADEVRAIDADASAPWNGDVEESQPLPLDGTIDLINVQSQEHFWQGSAHPHSWHRQQVSNQMDWRRRQALHQLKSGNVVDEVYIAL